MGKCRENREIALQILYRLDLETPIDEYETQVLKSILEDHLAAVGTETKTHEMTFLMVKGIADHIVEIDSLIENAVDNWTLDRLSVVDRNILRIAVFELKYLPDVPYKVAINEGIELAKSYSSAKSGKFVNGVLDKIHRSLGKSFMSTESKVEGMLFP